MAILGFLARAFFRLVALIALLAAIVSAANAQTTSASGFGRLGGIGVDVRPMIAMGAGAQAEVLRADLAAALQRSFGDRLVPNGPRLVVLVRSLSLNAYAGAVGGGRGGFGGGMQNDYLDGEALLVGRGGAVLARHPQLSALPASSGGAWYDPESERRRIAAIAEHYAQWLSRSLPAAFAAAAPSP